MIEIKDFLFDLNDTLISTRELFRVKMQEVYKILGLVLNDVAQEEIKTKFEDLNNAAYRTHNVNPKRWDIVLANFKQIYGSVPNETLDQCRETLMQIYAMVPEVKPGVVKTLNVLQQAGFGLHIVTHAWKDVTDFKLSQAGIGEYFNGRVYVADMNKPKNSQSWIEAMGQFNLIAKFVGAVGDSPTTDMKAAYEAGIENRYYVIDKNQWIMHKGELPKGTHKLKHGVKDLIPVLKSQGVL